MALTSARFAGVDRLERCAAGEFAARLTPGTQGHFVALVQQALMDLGEPLPHAGADGIYGDETVGAVLRYKTRHDLRSADGTIDGVVGPLTIATLDAECTARDQVPGPCPPDSSGPPVDLGGADETLVNVVLAKARAASFVGVDGLGATRLVADGVDVPEGLAAEAVGAAAQLLGGVPDPARLIGALGQISAVYAQAGRAETVQSLAEGMAFTDSVDPGPALAAFIAQALASVTPHGGTPVRDLSKPAAVVEANSHAALGNVSLSPGPGIAPDGSLILQDPKAKFSIGSTIAGVEFKVTDFGDRRLPSYRPVSAGMILLDIRHVVGLVRLALHLRAAFGVTEIHHCGISGDTVRTDCHGNGRAVDFVGALGVAPGGPFHLTVFNDWKVHSVPNLDDRTKPRRPDWPPVTRQLEYRLLDPAADPFARAFFADLYAFVASEWQDRTDGPGQVEPPSAIGQGSRIMTPDHPESKPGTKNGREAHHSHVHWQVGPTGTQAP
jgi:peptidoglycan hydrolase-like protein with peptidoglycan-binding domain